METIEVDPSLTLESEQKADEKASPAAFEFNSSFGDYGIGEGYFNQPLAIAIDSDENIYVLDSNNSRIQKFDKYGDFIKEWGQRGKDLGEFKSPRGLAIDSNDAIYVIDTGNDRIQKFDVNGDCIKTSENECTAWGTTGSSSGSFNHPAKASIDNDNNIYILDIENHRVQKFSSSGNFLTEWGNYGSSDGEFYQPVSIAYNNIGFGTIYVLDKIKKLRLQQFNKNGAYLKTIDLKIPKELEEAFTKPTDISFDNEGNLYILDQENSKIFKFKSDGTYINSWGKKGRGRDQLLNPMAILAYNDDIFIVDSGNNRIQRFSPTY